MSEQITLQKYNGVLLNAVEVQVLLQLENILGVIPIIEDFTAESFGFQYRGYNIISLGLANCQLSSLPDLSPFSCIESLTLYNNKFSALPSSIYVLQTLIYLNLYRNSLDSLSTEIEKLVNLRYLNLSENKLRIIPKSIAHLINLEYLDLYSNNLSNIPISIGQLQNLIYLNLSYNHLTELPESIGYLQNLTYLYLWGNNLKILPTSFKLLQQLKELKIKANLQIKTPRRVFNLLHDSGCTIYWQNAYAGNTRPLEGGSSRFWCPPKI